MTKFTPIIIGILLCFSINTFGQLSINEVMASNSMTLADNFGEYDDWIEIYNPGSSDINLSGYFISDDPTDLQKWNIPVDPSLTVVPAGGHLILWADNDPDQGAHHVDFKLSGSGEDLVLTATDGTTIIDQLSFGPQASDISYGRTTDGGNDFQLFSTPTPGAPNNGGGGLTYPVELMVEILSNSEDAQEDSDGTVELDGFGLQIGQDFGGNNNTIGMRFQLDLPQGAIVNNAFISLRSAAPNEDNVTNFNIRAELNPNAESFNTTNFNVSLRSLSNASVSWQPAAWDTEGMNGGLEIDNTPNIGSLIQEVVNQSTWEAGNSIVIIITGTGKRTCFNGGGCCSPTLTLEGEIPFTSDPIENVFINELAAGGTPHIDEGGDREDWIELYNANNFDVDLSGLYLTDDYGDLDKSIIPAGVIIPANGFLTFFADSDEEDGDLHTNFNLRSKGEQVALAMQLSSGLVILDSISFDDAPFMSSFGRDTDASNNWVLFGAPTPDASNNGANLYLAPPTFTLPSGNVTNMQSTELTHPESGVTIRYTNDSSIPSDLSTPYASPISISSTINYRARAYKAGYEPSTVVNAAYLLETPRNIPAIYLTTEWGNFFDDETGIYVEGTNGTLLCGPTVANFNQNWERPVNVKMFLPDGTEAFDVDAGVKISGVCSRNNAMKSLAISLRERDYGNGELGYRLFENRDHDNFLRFKLRNSGQDFTRMGFRDLCNQALLIDGNLELETQSGQPVYVYLNGQPWGIHNIREKYTGEFFDDNYGADPNKIDIIKSPALPWQEIKQGSDEVFDVMFDFIQANSLADDTNYNNVESQLDVNAFLNYWIPMLYFANTDWPANNLTVWKEQKPDSKWRYCIADTDGSTQNFLSPIAAPEYNTLDSVLNSAGAQVWPYHENSTLIIRKLMERQDFQDEFVQRACSFIGLIYPEEKAHHFADSIKAIYDPNISDHLQKWAADGAMGALNNSEPEDIAIWEGWIDAYKEFFTLRPDFFREDMDNSFNLDGLYNLHFNFDADTGGSIVVNKNEMEMPYNFMNLYFKNVPLRVKAIAKPGFEFSHWLETGVTDAEIDFISGIDATLTPIFVCSAMVGEACDDEDDCTIDDVFQEDCECAGIIPDLNMDGVGDELDCDFTDAVDIEPLKSQLKVFPNPTQSNLNIQLNNQGIKVIEIYNGAGIRVQFIQSSNSNEIRLNTERLPQGIYFIRLEAADGDFYFGNFSVMR